MNSSSAPTSSPGFSDDELRMLDAVTDRVVAARKAKAAAEAAEIRALAEALDLATARQARLNLPDSRRHDIPVREVAATLATAVRASDRTIQARLADADTVVTRFAVSLAALESGEIERGHLSVITEAGDRLDDDAVRAAYEQAALEVARRETPGRLRPIVRLLAERLQPLSMQERHDIAVDDRRAWVADGDDGMADLVLRCPAVVAHGAFDRATQMARSIIDARNDAAGDGAETDAGSDTDARSDAAPDTRTLAQVRADVLADMLLTGHATPGDSEASIPESQAIVARVHVTVPAATLEGGDEAGELAGFGPIDPETSRRLAATAPTWTRLHTAPTGCVLAVDGYRPTRQMRKLLAARDEHCRFPGCRQSVRRCDADHTVDAALGGPTHVNNLAHLCRRHHVLKHHSAWRVRQIPGGVLEWTSPTGRVYPDVPARTLTFTTTDPPPPF